MFRFPDALVVCGCVLGVALLASCGGDSTGPSRTPAQLAFTVQPNAVVEAGAAIRSAVQVTVQDAQGNAVTGATTNITLAITNGAEAAGATLGGTLTQVAVNGVATFGDLTVAPVGTGYTLTATATSLTSTTSAAFEVTPGAPVGLVVLTQPSAVEAGTAISAVVQVAVQNAQGVTVTNATTSVTLAITTGTGISGAALGGTVTVAAVAGVATFTDLSLDKVGTGYTLTASAAGLASATSGALTVSPGAAAKLAFAALPSVVVAGAAIAPAVRVTVQDALGNTATGSTASVTVAITGGTGMDGAVLGGTLTQAAVAGVATFPNLTVAKVGAGYTLTATAPSLTSAASTALAVTPGAVSRLVFTVQPSAVVAGTAISPAVKVTVLDAQGNTVTSSTANIVLAITSGTGTTGAALGGTATVAAVAGVATFANVTVAKAGTGYTLTASAAGLASATSGALAVSPGAAAKLAFTVQPSAAVVAGAAIAPAVQVAVQDAQGNTIASATTSIIVAISSGTGMGGAALGGTPTQDAVAGVATFADLSLDKTGTGYTLTASASGLASATSGALTVSPGAAAKLAFAVQPSAVVAGAMIAPAVKVTVQDAQGNTVTSATASIVLAISSGIGTPGAVLGGTLTQAAVAGVATFANLTLAKAGVSYTVTATATSLTSAASNAFTVTPGAASTLAFTVQPSAVVAGAAIGPAVQVTVQDALGNTLTSGTNSIALAITVGTGVAGAVLGGTATQAAVAGVASFTDLSFDRAGSGYTLTVSATGLTSAISSALTVSPGAAAKLVFTVQPSAVVAGAAMSPAAKVTVQDAMGNTITGATTNITLAITTGTGTSGAVFGGTPTQAAVAGVATFADLSLDKTGTGYTLRATAAGLTSATSNLFNVTPGAAAKLAVTAQPSAVVAGAAINPAVKVTVQDALGNTVTSATTSVTLAITAGTGTSGAVLGGTATTAAAAGVATFANLTLAKTGVSYTMTATAPNLTSATSTVFNVTPSAASKLVFTVQPSAVVAGAAIAPAIQVTVQDAQGNTVSSATTSAALVITTGTGTSGALLGGTVTVPAVAGVATFTDLSVDKAGTGYTLTASASGLASATSSALTVSAGAAAKLAFTVQPSMVVAGASIAPAVKVTVQDVMGNTITGATTSIVLAITGGTGTTGAALGGTATQAAVAGVTTFANLTVDLVGTNYALTATAPSLTSATSTAFVVTPGAANRLAFTVQPSAVVAGASIAPAVKVTVQDAQGNTVTGSTTNIVLAITSGIGTPGAVLGGTATVAATAGVATFANVTVAKAGAGYTLTASATGLTSATSTAFAVTPGAAAKLAVTVQPGAAVAGAAISPAIQVTVQDALGNTDTSATTSITLAIASGTGTSGAVLGGTLSQAAVAGVATFTDLSLDKAGPGYSLRATATATSLTSATSSAFTVTPGAASKLAFTVQPSAVVAGVAIAPAVKVTVQDALGNTVTNATTSVTLAIATGTSGAVLGGTLAQSPVTGVATFANLTVDLVGTGYALTATATNLTGAISTVFNTAAKLAVTVSPSAVVAGAVVAPAVQVTVRDALGNTVTSATTSITLAIAGTGGAALGGTLTQGAVAGVATFANLTLDKVGTNYTLTATATGLASATSSAFNVTPGTAAKLAVTVPPSAVLAAAAIGPAVEVTVQDAQGNTVTSATTSVTLAITANSGTSGATLGGTKTRAAVAGLATFADLTLNKAGTAYTLTATATNLTSAISTAFDVTPAAAAQLAFTVQPSAVVAAATMSPAVTVAVQDASGNLVTAASGTVTLALTTPGGATLTGGGAATVTSGVATFGGLSVDKVGSYTLTPTTTVEGATTLPASSSFVVSPGAANTLAFTVEPTAVVAGVAVSPAVKVTVQDAQGNTVSSTASITVAIGTNPSGGTLSGISTVSATGGTATFSALRLDKMGTGYTLTAAATSLTGATSAAFNVAPVLAFTVQPSASAAGAVIAPSVVVTIRDGQGNTVTSATTSVTLAITTLTGTSGAVLGGTLTQAAVAGVATFPDLTVDKVGTGYTLTATATSPSSTTSTAFAVTPGAASKLVFTALPSTVKAGAALSPAVQVAVQDANGNVVTAASGTVSLALTTPGDATLTGGGAVAVSSGLATFSDLKIDSVGTGYTLTATSAGLASTISGAVDVTTPITVSGVSPTNGAMAGGTTVTITGTNFVKVTGVTIGGVAIGSLIVVSSTQITGVSPVGASFGAKDVVVTSSTYGTVTCVGCFTYNPWAPIVTAGLEQSCGLTTGGAAYCWGGNGSGQLGDGSNTNSSIPAAAVGITFASLTAGWGHTCGLTAAGVAYCWGSNTYGQLGDGFTSNLTSPVAVSGGITFVSLTAGKEHTCGLTAGGAVYCWGKNDVGQLGNGTSAYSSIPVLVPGIPAFQAISAGAAHTCGLTTAGDAYCWGWNAYGQLGDGTTSNSTSPVLVSSGLTKFASLTAGWGHTCGLTAGGVVYCWGYNEYGQLGDGSLTSSPIPVAVGGTFASLTAGWGHTCGLTAAGVAWCWGRNDVGQVGDGSIINRPSPVLVSGSIVFEALGSGGYHSCGITTSPGRAAYCWGYNAYGQLGDGSITDRSTPRAVLSP